ncbi:uncharacterized protein LOC143300516 isoform X2 [Babylonia areolata]|uniref:uncharacterized protein LOC143300516 isoform X1 n=1 Tax=Babylonia areolata TaxID=304850 RepID=UPI003FD0A14A
MSGKIYELRFYTFNLQGKSDFKELHEDREFWQQRMTFSKVMGIFETEIFKSTEFFHFVEYDDLEDLFRARKALAESKDFWPKAQKVVEQYGTFHNCLAVAHPDTPSVYTQFPPSPTAVYELQTMKDGDVQIPWTDDSMLIARFRTMYGPMNNTEYRLFRYPDPKSAEAAGRKRMDYKEVMAAMTESRLMVPMPVSDLQ